MTTYGAFTFSPSSIGFLRWMTDPGRHVPAYIRDVMLVELFTSTGAIAAGFLNTSMVNIAAILLHCGGVFWFLLVADLIMGGLRLLVIRRVLIARKTGAPSPTNFHLITSLAWAAILGAVGYLAMSSNIPSLQTMSTATTIAICGANLPRFYPAPRFAIAMFSLELLPLIAGTLVASDHALRVIAMMTPGYYFAAFAIITRLQKISIAFQLASHESKFQARHDPLTGLLNRFGLSEALADHAFGDLPSLILFYLDLDGFKQINDTHGHPAGDALLRQVAERLKTATRGQDFAARVGGDEFVVVAPGMLPDDAEDFARRLIRRIEAPYRLEEAGEVRVGVSIGYACAPEDCVTLAGLYRQADAALYDVKLSMKGTTRRFRVAA
jgi:diguanylate cyclase (GGDEF)-like protein